MSESPCMYAEIVSEFDLIVEKSINYCVYDYIMRGELKTRRTCSAEKRH